MEKEKEVQLLFYDLWPWREDESVYRCASEHLLHTSPNLHELHVTGVFLLHHWPLELGEDAFILGTDCFDHVFRILYQLPWQWLFFTTFQCYYSLKIVLEKRQKSGFDNKKHYGNPTCLQFYICLRTICLLSFSFQLRKSSLTQTRWKSTCICFVTCVLHNKCTEAESISNS